MLNVEILRKPAHLAHSLLLASAIGFAASCSPVRPSERAVPVPTLNTEPDDDSCFGRYGIKPKSELMSGLAFDPDPFNNLALTPPMGFNSFNRFGYDINEKIIMEVADAMASNCMLEAGYEYINLDEGWQTTRRNPDGTIEVDTQKFPSGIKALSDYIHERGFKFGIYTSVGTGGCDNRVKRIGSKDSEELDAVTFASWEVDFLKIDWCPEGNDYSFEGVRAITKKWRDAIRKAGRPMVLSISSGGGGEPWRWSKDDSPNMWRVSTDIKAEWDQSDHSVLQIIDRSHMLRSIDYINRVRDEELKSFKGPNRWGWTDPDMLQVGNRGLSDTEARSHFSVWTIAAAPLLLGNDVRNMSEQTLEILLNGEVIAINQDPLGHNGRRISNTGGLQKWVKLLQSPNERAVLLFNTTGRTAEMTLEWKEVGLEGPVLVRDLWQRRDRGKSTQGIKDRIEPHGVLLIKATQEK